MKAKGVIYLSNIRLVFVASKPVDNFVAFDMPMVHYLYFMFFSYSPNTWHKYISIELYSYLLDTHTSSDFMLLYFVALHPRREIQSANISLQQYFWTSGACK